VEINLLSENQMAELLCKESGFCLSANTLCVSNLTLFENVPVAGYISKTKSAKETQERAGQLLAHIARQNPSVNAKPLW